MREIEALRRSNAQDRTDIQRLWRLAQRGEFVQAQPPWGLGSEEPENLCQGCSFDGPMYLSITQIASGTLTAEGWVLENLPASIPLSINTIFQTGDLKGWVSSCYTIPSNPSSPTYPGGAFRIAVRCRSNVSGGSFALQGDEVRASGASCRTLPVSFIGFSTFAFESLVCDPFYFSATFTQGPGNRRYRAEVTR